MDRYFSLKLMRLDLTPTGSGGGIRRFKPNLEKMKSFTNKSEGGGDEDAMGGMICDENGLNETGMDQATADRIEEARLAEEALASNLKLLKKQKAKFLRLQKILSRNVFLIPMCAVFSVLSAATIFLSTLSHNFESTYYDIDRLNSLITLHNNASLQEMKAAPMSDFSNSVHKAPHNAKPDTADLSSNVEPSPLAQPLSPFSIYSREQLDNSNREGTAEAHHQDAQFFQEIQFHSPQQIYKIPDPPQRRLTTHAVTSPSKRNLYYYTMKNYTDYIIITRNSISMHDNSSVKQNILYPTYAGIWCFCNNLSEKSKRELNLTDCTFYRTTNIEAEPGAVMGVDEEISDSGRDLVRMHNAAACCVIVSYFLLAFSWVTGLAAVVTKKVPVSLATAVLNLLIAVFLALLLAIIHRKIISEGRHINCFDLRTTFDIVCNSRHISFGYSLGLTWLALIFTIVNGICWANITKMQKLLFTHGYF